MGFTEVPNRLIASYSCDTQHFQRYYIFLQRYLLSAMLLSRQDVCQLLEIFLAGSGIDFNISTRVLLCYFLSRTQRVLAADRNV